MSGTKDQVHTWRFNWADLLLYEQEFGTWLELDKLDKGQ